MISSFALLPSWTNQNSSIEFVCKRDEALIFENKKKERIQSYIWIDGMFYPIRGCVSVWLPKPIGACSFIITEWIMCGTWVWISTLFGFFFFFCAFFFGWWLFVRILMTSEIINYRSIRSTHVKTSLLGLSPRSNRITNRERPFGDPRKCALHILMPSMVREAPVRAHFNPIKY